MRIRVDYDFRNAKGEYIGKVAHSDEEAEAIIEKAKKRGWNWTYTKTVYDVDKAFEEEIEFQNRAVNWNNW